MRVTSLQLANVRAMDEADFRFKSDFNIIVGVNGVGKSTVLDALRICFSRILPAISESRGRPMAFSIDDIRKGYPFLEAELSFTLGSDEFQFTRRQWRETFAADDQDNLDRLRREILEMDRLRDRPRNLLRELNTSQGVADTDSFAPSLPQLKKIAGRAEVAPNCIYFSTNRSVASNTAPSQSRAAGGRASAYAEALQSRPMFVAQFADWMRAQEALGKEQRAAARHLEVLQSAAARFLPAYQNLRPASDGSSQLVIDRNGMTIGVNQLSDGERSVLALVLDIARRLSQANPDLEDPLTDGNAVVLIDEIDLHLHPKWQRRIVHNLIAAFPGCQFIATTHSPQIIGEVEHDRIQIIANGQVYSPPYSYGVDSSRILEEVMETDSRAHEIEELLSKISREIGKQRYDDARSALVSLVKHLGENDPEVTRMRTLLNFLEDDE